MLPSEWYYEWRRNRLNYRIPYIISPEGVASRINVLHVHCKDLHKFASDADFRPNEDCPNIHIANATADQIAIVSRLYAEDCSVRSKVQSQALAWKARFILWLRYVTGL